MEPGGVKPRQDRGARRGAGGARRIGVRELRAALGEMIDMRRLIIVAAETTEIGPAEVVDEEEDKVGQFLRDGEKRRERRGCAEERRDYSSNALTTRSIPSRRTST